jgi:diguanylate cyclase (GGDEF)-like protein
MDPLRVRVSAPSFAAEALVLRLEAALPGADVARREEGGPGAPGDVTIVYVAETADPSRALGARDLDGGGPVIALCERLDGRVVETAFEAGASDCIGLRGLGPVALGVAVRRAASGAARLARCEERALELSRALARCRAERARAREAAATDPVTGLFGRRFFEERLAAEERAAFRSGRLLSLALIDLDGFKTVNDVHGHAAGDVVLREAGALLARSLRAGDVAARYGGDELVALLPDTPLAGAADVARRISAGLRALEVPGVPGGCRVSASIGVADMPGPLASTGAELFLAADRALRRAKEEGRDRVVVAEPECGGRHRGATGGAESGTAAWGAELERIRGEVRAISDRLRSRLQGELLDFASDGDLDGAGPAPPFGRARAVSEYGGRIAKALRLPADQVDCIRRAGLLQDLGMRPIAGAVSTAGALDERERALVRLHPALSVRIAQDLHILREELPVILHHHESFDGSGYPRGLSGARIPLGARVLAVAGAYEAMTSPRPYRASLSAEAASREIVSLAGARYDPAVIGAFQEAFAVSS